MEASRIVHEQESRRPHPCEANFSQNEAVLGSYRVDVVFPSRKMQEAKRKKNGLAVLLSWEADAKGGNIEVIFDDCGRRSHDRTLHDGVA
jgi:hypothetical protein